MYVITWAAVVLHFGQHAIKWGWNLGAKLKLGNTWKAGKIEK